MRFAVEAKEKVAGLWGVLTAEQQQPMRVPELLLALPCLGFSFPERATDGSLRSEDWALNMEICDIINETEEG